MEFIHYYKSRKGEMINLLKKLVDLESPSSDKKAVDRCASFAAAQFRKSGAKITDFPQKDIGNLHLVEYPHPGPKEMKERVTLLTHVDTVWPKGKIKEMPFYVSGDKIYGPGVLDMKAGLVMAVFSLRTLRDLNIEPRKKITVFMNSAEEIGSDPANEMIRNLAKRSSCILCLEPALPGGALKVQRKGRMDISLETKGKSAHAGNPQNGVNAVEELLQQLRHLQKLKTKSITMNIGVIRGGIRVNIVPDEAGAHLDFRFWKSIQKDKIIQFFNELQPTIKGAKIKYAVKSYLPPMEKTPASEKLLNQVRNIAASMGLILQWGKTGGGSDASIAATMGTATLDGLGPDGDGIHAADEHLLISSLVERTALLTEILRQL
ncbi:MAG: M20 family metallopeptidase [Candidatus Aminicenantes bacterium]|nr:M20 family metallopeptidase [Candidatus Aminicenantes bacterium]